MAILTQKEKERVLLAVQNVLDGELGGGCQICVGGEVVVTIEKRWAMGVPDREDISGYNVSV